MRHAQCILDGCFVLGRVAAFGLSPCRAPYTWPLLNSTACLPLLQDCVVGLLFALMPVLSSAADGDKVSVKTLATVLGRLAVVLVATVGSAVLIARTLLPRLVRALARHSRWVCGMGSRGRDVWVTPMGRHARWVVGTNSKAGLCVVVVLGGAAPMCPGQP